MEEKAKRKNENRKAVFDPYEWQKKFYGAGSWAKQRLLMAANRVGKTYSQAYEVACHLTGDYPEWWTGVKFDFPITVWGLGVTGEQIRDVIQKELLGDFEGQELDGRGAVPKASIIQESVIRSSQTKNLVKEVKIRRKDGGISTLSLKAYSQGQHVLMGQGIDFIWIDEEPKDQAIYPQCITRTSTGNQGAGGYVAMTFTPENGMTPLVAQFMESLQDGQYLQNVTWDDAPHLTEETKSQLLSAIPEYQRDMRSKGIPVLGSGIIFPISDDDIKCDPFPCPDHWHVINGCDFGWDHPQAHVQLWWDKDEDMIYLAHAWKKSQYDAVQAWSAVKAWSQNVPVSWPHDGLQHEKGGGEQLKMQYQEAGFKMLPEMATWPEGGNSVEAGIWEMLNMMREGRFKVFSTLNDWFEEKRLYHRDDKSRIVKERDDLISATRYAYMMRRFAKMKQDIVQGGQIRPVMPKPIRPMGRR